MRSTTARPRPGSALSPRFTPLTYLRTGELPAPFDSNAIPSTVILGPHGQGAARHDGMAEYDTPEFKASQEQLAKSVR